MAADPWTTLAKVFEHDAVALRARAAGRADAAALLLEAERLEQSADRQRELAVLHGCGSARWGTARAEATTGDAGRSWL